MRISATLTICGAVTALVYLLFAFVMWDANPGNWSGEARVWCAYFATCLCAIPAIYRYFGAAA